MAEQKLSDFQPKWLHPNLFVFLCPHCHHDWLAVNDADIKVSEQFDLYEKEFGPDWNLIVVPAPQKHAWQFSTRDFETISVTPSVDASNSGTGHWHGFITNGKVTP